MGTETVFAINGVFEEEILEGAESKSHITTKENKQAKTGEILNEIGQIGSNKDAVEGELTKENGDIEKANIYEQDRFLGEGTIKIENGGNSDSNNEKTDKFGGEVIGVLAIEEAVDETPKKSSGESDLDVLPSGFVDGAEETDDTIVMSPIVNKMGKGTEGRNSNDTEPENQNIVHGFIIT